MPLDNILLRKSESPLEIAVQRKLPALSIFKEAPSLTSNDETRSCPFLRASSKGVFPKLSMERQQSFEVVLVADKRQVYVNTSNVRIYDLTNYL